MNLLNELAVQSFCFRNITENQSVAGKVKEIGLERVEVCRVHADFHAVNDWKDIVKIYNDAGVSIVSIGVETFDGEDRDEAIFESAALAGAKQISCHFKIETFQKAVAQVKSWSEQYGVDVGIHNHGGYMFGGCPDIINYLIELGSPNIGLCMDTAWVMQIGPQRGNPVQWAKDYRGKIKGIHFKDFTFAPNGQWKDTIVGEGTLDLKGLVSELESQDFSGVSILEYEADPDNPVPALKSCVEKMREITSSLSV
ncbi:sugar phosphate isomerase/epimerase family protein [Pelagicoccus mobilis]|uniref:Sugar phosphate isomerase/epimerase n=1 Tax=Pelagicoccus mobilis TaxID=415221 RepID=A0A934RXR5_9BACT|nr:sugar phosphate isomerase/epimerase family protein [Pelagicoccus mobilis]MBK1878501.1 sugar phosphate isomerase/epimerase [Pelagicoccus mobilis]